MGTYTTNYNLFMPTIGEQGWGELINGNFTTIDTTMAGLNTRVGTLEIETTHIYGRVTTLEAGEFNSINCSGNIAANELLGKRVGIPTTTKPNDWAVGHGMSLSNTVSHTSTDGLSHTVSSTKTYTVNFGSSVAWYDEIDLNINTDYTIDFGLWVGAGNRILVNSVTVKFRDYFTNEVILEQTYTTFTDTTLSAPAFTHVELVMVYGIYSGYNVSSTVTISRPTIYFKTKGT